MSCKICSPPAVVMCPRCKAEVRAQVLELADRIRGSLSRMSRDLAGTKLIKEERTVAKRAAATG